MGSLMRAMDWSRTALGPIDRWPQSLRAAISMLLHTGFPMYIAWGPSFTQFYNDGYRPILGSTKHPAALGISTRETFAEIWHIIGPMFEGVMRGETVTARRGGARDRRSGHGGHARGGVPEGLRARDPQRHVNARRMGV